MKIAIIGAGQQGASIARALATRSDHYDLSLYDVNKNLYAEFDAKVAEDKDVFKSPVHFKEALSEAVANADIVILATPIDKFSDILSEESFRGAIKPGVIVTDVGSAKTKSIREIRSSLPDGAIYVPAHPVVGRSGVGPGTSDANMYQNNLIAIIPENYEGYKEAAQAVKTLWHDTGARTMEMSAFQHDSLYGTISHFEHPVAFALTEQQADSAHGNDYQLYGSSTLDISRIADASAPMWKAIFEHNGGYVLKAAQGFSSHLASLKEALQADDPKALEEFLRPAHDFRKEIVEARIRESLPAEIHDFISFEQIEGAVADDPESLKNSFNDHAKQGLARRHSLPVAISAAITHNAIDVEKDLKGLKIKDMANPSFLDGTAPMLNDPQYLAEILHFNRDELLKEIDGFEQKFNRWIDEIRDFDGDTISAHIEEAARLRKSMPAHRNPATMRDEHDIATHESAPAHKGAFGS